MFDYNINATSFRSCFRNCENLETIPDNLFANNSYCEDYGFTFENCKSLRVTFKDIFKNAIGAKTFIHVFAYCKGLDGLPDGIFRDAVNATDYTNVILGATRIRTIPIYAFNGNNATFSSLEEVQKIEDYGMNGLNVPQGYFKNGNLMYIGKFIFSNNVTDYTSMFEGNEVLREIDKQDFSNVVALDNIFTGCTLLETVGGFFNKETNEPALKKVFRLLIVL